MISSFPIDYSTNWRIIYTKEDAWLFLFGRCALYDIIRTSFLERNKLRWVGTMQHNDKLIRSGKHLLKRVLPSFFFPGFKIVSICFDLCVNQLFVLILRCTFDSLLFWSDSYWYDKAVHCDDEEGGVLIRIHFNQFALSSDSCTYNIDRNPFDCQMGSETNWEQASITLTLCWFYILWFDSIHSLNLSSLV